MGDWLPTLAATGKWVLAGAVGTFVVSMLALLIYALRKGGPGDTDVSPDVEPFGPYSPTGRRGIVAYRGVRKLKLVASRKTYVSMETLLSGTATRAQWALFIGIQLALVCFWLIFFGLGLRFAPTSNGVSLLFVVVPSLWYLGVLKTVRNDVVAARKKLARTGRAR